LCHRHRHGPCCHPARGCPCSPIPLPGAPRTRRATSLPSPAACCVCHRSERLREPSRGDDLAKHTTQHSASEASRCSIPKMRTNVHTLLRWLALALETGAVDVGTAGESHERVVVLGRRSGNRCTRHLHTHTLTKSVSLAKTSVCIFAIWTLESDRYFQPVLECSFDRRFFFFSKPKEPLTTGGR